MGSIDSKRVLLICADTSRERWLPGHGSRRPRGLDGVPTAAVPAQPGKADLDPVLAEHDPRRLLVAGTDADLAAVLLRLLRSERLDVEVAHLPVGRSAWDARGLALDAPAKPTPLVRDDTGGVLVGRAEIRDLRGECYCDDTLVLRGTARRLVVAAGPDGIRVRAGHGSRLPDGRTRPVPPFATSGHGSATGRAVQVGGDEFVVTADGVPHPRPLTRRTWYRHTSDWLLVRP